MRDGLRGWRRNAPHGEREQAGEADSRSAISPPSLPPAALPSDPVAATNFSAVSKRINDAIAADELPGAVVMIGHGGKVVFHQAYGLRKLAGEPGLDGSPAPAEPMTEDTIFDLASLTKVLATAPAVMQLYEHGMVRFDDPVQQYLPDFNAANDPERSKVTVRMLLDPHFRRNGRRRTQRSVGTGPARQGRGYSSCLNDAAGVAARCGISLLRHQLPVAWRADREAHRRAGRRIRAASTYLPRLAWQRPAIFRRARHVVRTRSGALPLHGPLGRTAVDCPAGTWSTSLLSRIAPTARDEEGRADPGSNPDLDHLLRGTVHDTTARRMGGIAGHAGVFSTAHDVSVYAQSLLDRLAGRPSVFPLAMSTLVEMTTPQQPGHAAGQVEAANEATRAARPNTSNPLLAPRYPAVSGQNLRGFGWDIDTAQSATRGVVFPVGSFGHTGFTGTSVWMDPGSDTYVVLLANSIHTRGSPPLSTLRGEVATAAAQALGI